MSAKNQAAAGTIRVGIGGWTYAPWRDNFYPAKLPHAKELAFASREVTTIEVNGTYYRTQTRESFRRWAEETPDDFVFSLKAVRYATNRKDLADAKASVETFLDSGITELGAKLGPILWQLAPTKAFHSEEIDGFLSCLPNEIDGRSLRHVLEVRHPSFCVAEFVTLARARNVAICLAISDDYPLIADPTADFVYLRLQTSRADEANGFDAAAIMRVAEEAKSFAAGHVPARFATLVPPKPMKRDCFVYVIAGAKERNPDAARALLARLKR